MTDPDHEEQQARRFDQEAAGYDRWWAPVLAPSAGALLDRLAPVVDAGATDVLDVGVGTGNLSRPALARWPRIRVTGLDASREMVETATALIADAGADHAARFSGTVAFAGDMPFPDRAFDVAMSSFVLQLVPNRAKVLREVRRVLRPGGHFAYVTWLVDERAFKPDRVFDDLLAQFGFEDEEDRPRSGDIPSVERAVAELRRAGFRDVDGSRATLDHAFSVESYMAFLTEFDEASLFDEMDRAERRRFLALLREGLMRLDPDDLHFRVGIVYASGTRSG
ncbi:MAG TPA: class I SAM-dependent methyltransferase [Candidatus Limnocylindrales bacterium]|nr:class I SAM-dependent methyltransferase [Candidatus Limnocylindrales bacterium]